MHLDAGLETEPFGGVRQARIQLAIAQLPVTDQIVEVVHRGSRRRLDQQRARAIEMELRDWQRGVWDESAFLRAGCAGDDSQSREQRARERSRSGHGAAPVNGNSVSTRCRIERAIHVRWTRPLRSIAFAMPNSRSSWL